MTTKYHVNPETGNTGECTAQPGNCLYGSDEPHYASEPEARESYERSMDAHISSITTVSILNEIPLKSMDAALLATTLYKEAQQNGMDAHRIASSIDVASLLHVNQKRSVRQGFDKTPYVEHPLRNAIRLMRLGVRDNDLIVAAVLHDCIEDGGDVFLRRFLKKPRGSLSEVEVRRYLSKYIQIHYGDRVLKVVEAVTNPLEKADPSMSKAEAYRHHVVEQIQANPGAYMVKYSDFIDNAGSLHHQAIPGNEKLVQPRAAKYLPLIADFREYLPTVRGLVSKDGYNQIRVSLDILEDRLNALIEKGDKL